VLVRSDFWEPVRQREKPAGEDTVPDHRMDCVHASQAMSLTETKLPERRSTRARSTPCLHRTVSRPVRSKTRLSGAVSAEARMSESAHGVCADWEARESSRPPSPPNHRRWRAPPIVHATASERGDRGRSTYLVVSLEVLHEAVWYEQLVRDQGSLACGPPNMLELEHAVDKDRIQGVSTDLAVACAG
jgi:hypothetical protein